MFFKKYDREGTAISGLYNFSPIKFGFLHIISYICKRNGMSLLKAALNNKYIITTNAQFYRFMVYYIITKHI